MSARMKIVLAATALLIVAAAVVVVARAYLGDLRRGERAVVSPGAQVFSSSLGDVEYVLEGSGPTVVISHGITGGIDQGAGLARTYLGPGYRLLLVSRFGYLRSAMPAEASAELQARAYRELLDHLGIERTFVLGNSAGGTSALRFAIAYPGRCAGLILVSSNVPGGAATLPPRPVMATVFGSSFVYWAAARLAPAAMLGMFVPKPLLADMSPGDIADLRQGILLSGLPIDRRTRGVLFDMYVSNPSIEGSFPFEQISSPTLIVHAEDDPACPIAGARLLAAKIPGSRLLAFERGGHLLLGVEEDIRKGVGDFAARAGGVAPGRD